MPTSPARLGTLTTTVPVSGPVAQAHSGIERSSALCESLEVPCHPVYSSRYPNHHYPTGLHSTCEPDLCQDGTRRDLRVFQQAHVRMDDKDSQEGT
jgi:hypothetical protein